MKFIDKEVQKCAGNIEKDLNELNQWLSDLQDGLEFITSSNNWRGNVCDYYRGQLKDVYTNFGNLKAISSNINTYLNSVIANYQRFESTSFLDGKGNSMNRVQKDFDSNIKDVFKQHGLSGKR